MNQAFLHQRAAFKEATLSRYGITEATFDFVTRKLADIAVPLSLRKGEYLQRIGTPAQSIYWLHMGVARHGFFTEHGTEVTLRFSMAGESAGSHADLLGTQLGVPARHFIVAETPIEGYSLNWQEICRLHDRCDITRGYYLKICEYSIRRHARHAHLNIAASARARLNAFRDEHPGLESRIAQKVLASYLGITAQYLSQLLRADRLPQHAPLPSAT